MTMLPLLLSALLLSTADVWMMMPQALSDAVLDTNGQMLEAGTQYYVLPGVHGQGGGGGLTLQTRNGKCLMYVIQDESNTSSGTPAFFHPVNNTSAVIRVSMDVKIAFLGERICQNSTISALDYLDGPMGHMYMRASLVDVWFKIERDGVFYKIQACLSDSSMGWTDVCGNVGVLKEDGQRWLAWTYEPLPVVFKKV